MLRWIATAAIGLLLLLTAFIPQTSLGRRGHEAATRAEVETALGKLGERLPAFTLYDLDGQAFRLSDFRGKRVLITFERSVDW